MYANGVRASDDGTGLYSALLPLEPGVNRILIVVTDGNANSATATVNVTYVDPVPALQQELDLTAQELENATAAAFDYFLKIDTIEGESNDTKAKLNDTLGLLNATQAEVERLSHELTHVAQQFNETVSQNGSFYKGWIELNSHAEDTSNRLNETQAELNSSRAILQNQQSDIDFVTQRAEVASSSAATATAIAAAGVAMGVAGLGAAARALARDPPSGMSSGKRGRETGSGMATGKRQHSPIAPDGGESPGDERSVSSPRDAASGQATGKRQHAPAAPDGGGPDAETAEDKSREYSPAKDQLKGKPRH
jgi:hypothetical protein